MLNAYICIVFVLVALASPTTQGDRFLHLVFVLYRIRSMVSVLFFGVNIQYTPWYQCLGPTFAELGLINSSWVLSHTFYFDQIIIYSSIAHICAWDVACWLVCQIITLHLSEYWYFLVGLAMTRNHMITLGCSIGHCLSSDHQPPWWLVHWPILSLCYLGGHHRHPNFNTEIIYWAT